MGKRILTKEALIAKEIEYLIEKEEYKDKQKLPSERELALRFFVQRLTVRRALQILVQRGVVFAKERSGYYLAPRRIRITLNEAISLKSVIEKVGRSSATKLLSFEKIMLGEKIAQKTMIPEGTEAFQILRLRYENKTPLALEKSYLIAEAAPGLTAEDVFEKSLYEVLKKKCGITVGNASQQVSVVYANGLEAELLKVNLTKPLMKYQGLVYDVGGKLIEYFENITLIERIEIVSRERVTRKQG